jgi:hypothetical protein
MSRAFKLTLLALLLAVLAGLLYLPGLTRQVLRMTRLERSEQRARREVIRPISQMPAEKTENVGVYWISRDNPRQLAAEEVAVPLARDPLERARLALDALINGPAEPERRTVPADTALLELYLLPDGTAIADFSDALASEVPSGIWSEQLAVDSIARTVHAALPWARRLCILIEGQEEDTLAGHVELREAIEWSPASATPAASAAPWPQAAPAAQGIPPVRAGAAQGAPPGKTSGPAEKKATPR